MPAQGHVGCTARIPAQVEGHHSPLPFFSLAFLTCTFSLFPPPLFLLLACSGGGAPRGVHTSCSLPSLGLPHECRCRGMLTSPWMTDTCTAIGSSLLAPPPRVAASWQPCSSSAWMPRRARASRLRLALPTSTTGSFWSATLSRESGWMHRQKHWAFTFWKAVRLLQFDIRCPKTRTGLAPEELQRST